MSHKSRILLNNEPVITGGELSCGVIYNNLTGKNFPDPFSGQTHEQYLDYMEWADGITYQGILALEHKGKIIARQTLEPRRG